MVVSNNWALNVIYNQLGIIEVVIFNQEGSFNFQVMATIQEEEEEWTDGEPSIVEIVNKLISTRHEW